MGKKRGRRKYFRGRRREMDTVKSLPEKGPNLQNTRADPLSIVSEYYKGLGKNARKKVLEGRAQVIPRKYRQLGSW